MKLQERYGVYFDESAKDGVYVFTAAIIKQSTKRALERRLLNIRKDMTRAVLSAVPELAAHHKLKDGRLLEIHAVDLYQSGGIFREVKRQHPTFWLKQHEWLRQALEVTNGYGVKLFTVMSTDEMKAESIRRLGLPNQLIGDFRFKSVVDRFDSIFDNPYFLALLNIMHQVNDYLVEHNATGELYCHTYDDAHSYSVLQSYEVVRRRGHFTQIERPVFRTCTEEQCIQCADVSGYVLLQAHVAEQRSRTLKPEFIEWGRKYIINNVQPARPRPSDDAYDLLGLIVFEIFAMNPAGPTAFQSIVRALMAEHIKQEDGREPPMREFLQAALELYDQTNKPSAEAEDLYGGSLPHDGTSDNASGDPA